MPPELGAAGRGEDILGDRQAGPEGWGGRGGQGGLGWGKGRGIVPKLTH